MGKAIGAGEVLLMSAVGARLFRGLCIWLESLTISKSISYSEDTTRPFTGFNA